MKKILALLVSVVMLLAVGAVYANAFGFTTVDGTGPEWEYVVTAVQTAENSADYVDTIVPETVPGFDYPVIGPDGEPSADGFMGGDSADTDISTGTDSIIGTLTNIVCPSCGYEFLLGGNVQGGADAGVDHDDNASADSGAHPGWDGSHDNSGADTDPWGAPPETCAPADTHIPEDVSDAMVNTAPAPAPAPVEPETAIGRYAYREEAVATGAPTEGEWMPETTTTPEDDTWMPEEDTYVPDDKDDEKENIKDENTVIGGLLVVSCPKCGYRFKMSDALSPELSPDNQLSSAEKNEGADDEAEDDTTKSAQTYADNVRTEIVYVQDDLSGCTGVIGASAATVVIVAAAAAVALRKKD